MRGPSLELHLDDTSSYYTLTEGRRSNKKHKTRNTIEDEFTKERKMYTMNVDTGELRHLADITNEELESGLFKEVPDNMEMEANWLMNQSEPVDFNGSTNLSAWAKQEHFKFLAKNATGNRAERRKSAKRSMRQMKASR